jgi:hypothetical protein
VLSSCVFSEAVQLEVQDKRQKPFFLAGLLSSSDSTAGSILIWHPILPFQPFSFPTGQVDRSAVARLEDLGKMRGNESGELIPFGARRVNL